jgi:hypothetical protein
VKDMSLETSMLRMSGIRYRERYVFRDFNVEGEWNKISSKICFINFKLRYPPFCNIESAADLMRIN